MFDPSFAPRAIEPTCPPARCELNLPPVANRFAVLLVGCDPVTDASCRHSLSVEGIDSVVSARDGSLAVELLRAQALFDAVVVSSSVNQSDARILARHAGHRQLAKPTFFVKPSREPEPSGNDDAQELAVESLRSPQILGQKVSAALIRHAATRCQRGLFSKPAPC